MHAILTTRRAPAALAAAILGLGTAAPLAQDARPEPPKFEVVSIKPSDQSARGIQWTPGRFSSLGTPMVGLLNMAWGQPLRLEGGPAWVRSSFWDIIATWDPTRTVKVEERAPMLRAMVEDKFKIVLRREAREAEVYALTMARPDGRLGPALRRADQPCDAPGRPTFSPRLPEKDQRPACGFLGSVLPDGMALLGGNSTLELLIRGLSTNLQRPVVDRTGLTGEFDIVLTFARDSTVRPLPIVPPGATIPDAATPPAYPNIFTAIQEQLGLKLESTRAPVDYHIVDRIEMPAAP